MPRLKLLSIILCFATTISFGQSTGTLRGESLPFANLLLKGTRFSTTADQNGKFTITNIPHGEYTIIVSSIGYETTETSISINKSVTEKNFHLKESTEELSEVVVQAEKQSVLKEQQPISIKSVEIRNVIAQNVILTDVADRISGVRIRRSSSLGEKSDVSINGLRGSAIRMYVDGLPMEFLYPNFDISTFPLSAIERIDVYKGVLPVDIATDAMGGAIAITTQTKMNSHARASYGIGSFNTHLADFDIGLASKRNAFFSINGAFNYSDNDYKMKAFVFEDNKVEKVKRFHDAYQMSFIGINAGVHSKSWADVLKFTANYATGYKQVQNGLRISTNAIGAAKYTSENYSASLRYEKAFFNDRLEFSNNAAYSFQELNFVDTSSNVYSWSGKILATGGVRGEYAGEANSTTNYSNYLDRATARIKLSENHRLMISSLYANQGLSGKDHLKRDDERDYLEVPQYLTKIISGLQYDGKFFERLDFTTAVKNYHYKLDGAENNTFLPIIKEDGFWGWNAGLKYELIENLSVKGSYERGYLIPYFEQFVGNGADIVRNTNLKPESSDNVNVGLSYSTQQRSDIKVSSNLNGFFREQYDIIYLNDGVAKRYTNADQVQTIGMDGDVVLRYKNSWTWTNNITWLHQEFSKIKEARNQYLEGTAFPNNPKFYVNTELAWTKDGLVETSDKFRAYAYYMYVAPFNHRTIGGKDTYKTAPDNFVPTQNRLDLGFSYKFSKNGITAAFNAVNVLNADLYDNFKVPRAGISFNAKVIFEINKLKNI